MCPLRGQQPVLSVSEEETGDVRIAWPAALSGFVLESAPSLGTPPQWSVVAQTPGDEGEEQVVRLGPAGEQRFFRLRSVQMPLIRVSETSPANGAHDVSVTRDTVFRFSEPVAANSAIGPDTLVAVQGGRRLLSRAEMSAERDRISVFYLEDLAPGSRVEVTFNPAGLTDSLGRDVDADADGQPGGARTVFFDTFSAAPIAGTAVIGQVFASDPAPGEQPGEFVNRPLAGVVITVDGAEETLRAVTGADGSFVLSPAPAGRFFVHVDGRTAVGSGWPDGDYYPFIGKAWEAVAGRTNNLAAGTGEIFLPLIRQGTLQAV